MNIGLSYSHVILIISTEAPSGASSAGVPEQGGPMALPLLPWATTPLHAQALWEIESGRIHEQMRIAEILPPLEEAKPGGGPPTTIEAESAELTAL